MNPTQTTKKILFWLGLSLPTVALLVMAWLVHQSAGKFHNSFNWVMQSYQVLDLFEQTQGDILDAEANQRGYLMTGRANYLEPYHVAMGKIHDDITQLKKLTMGTPSQQSNLAVLEKMVNEDLVFDPATAFPSGQTPASASVVALNESGKLKLDRLRRLLMQSHQDQQQALSRRQQEAEANVANSQVTSLVLLSAVALALILVVVVVMRLERLQEFVTVCAWTGQVKFQGHWVKLDDYLKQRFGINVSHSLSQEAADKMKKEIDDLNRKDQSSPPSAG